MSVYDKELVINGKAVRSPEQQVYQNMKDIKALQEVIKPEYNTTAELTEASVTVALSTTNAPSGTTEGWLLTQDGLKFKITGGDGIQLLLEFYADLKGPQGEAGESGATVSDKGVFITSVAPTEDSGIYTLSTGSIDNPSTQDIEVKVNDIIIYIDSDDQPTSMWQVVSISGTTITVQQVGVYAKGKQSYQHNVLFTTSGGGYVCCANPIINDIATDFTISTFAKWLYDNGFRDGDTSPFGANGKAYDGGYKHIYAVSSYDGANISAKFVEGTSYSVTSVTDKVVTI